MMRILLFSIFFLLTARSFAQPTVAFSLYISGLTNPVDITGAGDGTGRLFVVEKAGVVRIIENNVLGGNFLDLQDSVETGGERGLLGIAFHPLYPDSPYVFVNYVQKNTNTTRICRFKLNPGDPNDLLETSQKILITQAGIQSNHKAGDLAFGPDGYLYIGMGDGGGGGDPGENGQNINSLLAKILRIDINVGVPPYFAYPPDNPYVGVDGHDAIWAIGMRNPWRLSFDRATGDLWIGDVGQDLWEEIDFIYAGSPGGKNFGWDCKEGNHTYESAGCPGESSFTNPVFEYQHNCGSCSEGSGHSVSGGFVYRGNAYPVLKGYYVFSDYVNNHIWTLKQTGFGNPPAFSYIYQPSPGISGVVSFGEADNGELYALDYNNGRVYSVSATGTLAVGWTNIKATPSHQGNKIEWSMDALFGINHFEVQRSFFADFNEFIKVAEVTPDPNETNYQYNDPFINSSGSYYRIAAFLDDGSIEYSPRAHIPADPKSKPQLTYDFNTNLWRINIPENWQDNDLTLYDLQGRKVYTKKITTGPLFDLPSPDMPGCYFIVIRGSEGIWSDRIVSSTSKPN